MLRDLGVELVDEIDSGGVGDDGGRHLVNIRVGLDFARHVVHQKESGDESERVGVVLGVDRVAGGVSEVHDHHGHRLKGRVCLLDEQRVECHAITSQIRLEVQHATVTVFIPEGFQACLRLLTLAAQQ